GVSSPRLSFDQTAPGGTAVLFVAGQKQCHGSSRRITEGLAGAQRFEGNNAVRFHVKNTWPIDPVSFQAPWTRFNRTTRMHRIGVTDQHQRGDPIRRSKANAQVNAIAFTGDSIDGSNAADVARGRGEERNNFGAALFITRGRLTFNG